LIKLQIVLYLLPASGTLIAPNRLVPRRSLNRP
jgi:hypothetical protein